jgi:YD repeat-containing protein
VPGTITRGYDGLNRLTSETTPEGSLSYTYDADGRRATMTVAGQPVVTYAYDDAHRLTSITQGTSVVASPTTTRIGGAR